MYVVTVLFEIAAGHEEAFADRVLRQAADSLEREPACRVFDVCRDPLARGRFFLYELYDDREAFDAHLRSAHFLSFDAAVRDWVTDKQVGTYERIHADR